VTLHQVRRPETALLSGAAAAGALAAALVCGGCVLALLPEKLLAGRPFPAVRLAELQTGMTAADVRSILGEPLTRRPDQQGETWRYESLYQLRGCRPQLLFIPLAPSAKQRRTATLRLRDDRLVSVTLETRGGSGDQGVRHFLPAGQAGPGGPASPGTDPTRASLPRR
jgi:outer membrane protein assembly factor BamE (lipoprotein component of BamABCDE complex)